MAEEDDAFSILYDEYEAFKQTYEDMEAALNRQLEEARSETRVLKRQVAEEQKAKESYRMRLTENTSGDEELRRTIAELEEQVGSMKKARSSMQNEMDTLERLNRQFDFTLSKLTSERDEAVDSLIIVKEDLSDCQERLAASKGELMQVREQLAEAKMVPAKTLNTTTTVVPTTSPSATHGVRQAGDSESLGEALEMIATRLRSIAQKCRTPDTSTK